jgi:hypothetical protein
MRQWFKRGETFPVAGFTVINCMMPDHTVRRFQTCEYGCCAIDAEANKVLGDFEWSVADDQTAPVDSQGKQ